MQTPPRGAVIIYLRRPAAPAIRRYFRLPVLAASLVLRKRYAPRLRAATGPRRGAGAVPAGSVAAFLPAAVPGRDSLAACRACRAAADGAARRFHGDHVRPDTMPPMSGENEKEDSLKRTSASASGLAKIGITALAGAVFGPAGTVVLNLATLLPKHALGLLKEKRQRRIEQLHDDLLEGVPQEEVQRLVDRLAADPDTMAHYAAILEQVYEDDEDEKVGLYARLLRHLATRPTGASRGRDLERHVIRTLRELAFGDVELLREFLNLQQHYPAVPASESEQDPTVHRRESENWQRHQQFRQSLSPLQAAGLRRLEYSGLVQRESKLGGERYDVTPIRLKLLTAVER
jgi:hypothetical protein